MARIAFICPGGDSSADDLAIWGQRLRQTYANAGHSVVDDVGDGRRDRSACESLMRVSSSLVAFFGHGRQEALLGSNGEVVIDEQNLPFAAGKTIVSVACEAGYELGRKAIQAGVRAHLGWNVILLWLARPGVQDHFRDAIVESLAGFLDGASVAEVADEAERRLNSVARTYRQSYHQDRNMKIAYFAAAAAAGQVALDGDRKHRPLADNQISQVLGWVRWKVSRTVDATRKSIQGGANYGR